MLIFRRLAGDALLDMIVNLIPSPGVAPAYRCRIFYGGEQTDPLVKTFTGKTGEHTLASAGELHLEICLKDLKDEYMRRAGWTVSEPAVSYCEGISSKTGGMIEDGSGSYPEMIVAKLPNKHNRLDMWAEPMFDELCQAIDNKHITPTQDCKFRPRILASDFGWQVGDARKISLVAYIAPVRLSHDSGMYVERDCEQWYRQPPETTEEDGRKEVDEVQDMPKELITNPMDSRYWRRFLYDSDDESCEGEVVAPRRASISSQSSEDGSHKIIEKVEPVWERGRPQTPCEFGEPPHWEIGRPGTPFAFGEPEKWQLGRAATPCTFGEPANWQLGRAPTPCAFGAPPEWQRGHPAKTSDWD